MAMATTQFLLQGFRTENHLNALKRLFELANLQRVILSAAYLNKGGVQKLASELKGGGPRVDVFAGIRNDVTSIQGLQALLDYGVNVHYVDTGARHLTFHPKVYFARAETEARLVLGSANLTLGGLNNNIEASVTLDLELTNPIDLQFADSVVAGFADLTSEYPGHVVRVSGADELQTLREEGRLFDERTVSPSRMAKGAQTGKRDGLKRIPLKVRPMRGSVERFVQPRSMSMPTESGKSELSEDVPPQPASGRLLLVWASKPLTERDLLIPSGRNTHPTGSINLDKGLLEKEIDHRHYFREDVFQALSWNTRGKAVEIAFAKFQLIVKGVECGSFELRIAHSTSTSIRSYQQRNAMTRLSWGAMKSFVAKQDLIQRTMFLYRDASDPTRFVIEID